MQTRKNIKELIMDLVKSEELYVVLPNMALGAGIGVLVAGVGVWFGGIPGIVAGIVIFINDFPVKSSGLVQTLTFPYNLKLSGAAAGGVALACMGGVFKPLTDYLENLSPEMQEMLYNGVKLLLAEVIWVGLDMLLEKVMGDTKLKNKILYYIKCFVKGSLKLRVVQKKKT